MKLKRLTGSVKWTYHRRLGGSTDPHRVSQYWTRRENFAVEEQQINRYPKLSRGSTKMKEEKEEEARATEKKYNLMDFLSGTASTGPAPKLK